LTEKKIQDLSQFHDAFCLLFPEHIPQAESQIGVETDFSGDFLADFNELERCRAFFKREISITNHAKEFADILKLWLSIESQYVYAILGCEISQLKTAKIEGSVDLMTLRKELIDLEVQGVVKLDEIYKVNELPQNLSREIQRCQKFIELEKR
jgi:hypothetical protein